AAGSFALPLLGPLLLRFRRLRREAEVRQRRGRILFAVEVRFAASQFAVRADAARGQVPRDRLAFFIRLVGRFAQFRLSRTRPGRIRVRVHVVVVDDRRAAKDVFGRGSVGGRRGRVALVVRPRRRDHGAGARDGANADVLGLQAGDVAEGGREVVAVRLGG